MSNDNGAPVGVGAQDLISPRQHGGVRIVVVFEIKHDEIHPSGAEEVEMIVIVGAIMARVIGASGKVIRPEVLVVINGGRGRPAADRFLVVVADGNTVRDSLRQQSASRTLDPIHRIGGVAPFGDICAAGFEVAVLDDVSELRDISDIA